MMVFFTASVFAEQAWSVLQNHSKCNDHDAVILRRRPDAFSG